MRKTLSLVIPAYNEERHIRTCLDAIAAQTELPDEVIVVDNNSTDDTIKIAKDYPFVTVVHEKQQGIVYARNTGFNVAVSEIIGRIDADSRLPLDWCARVRKFYVDTRNADSALTGGGYFYNVRLPRLNGWLQGQFAYRINRFIIGYYVLWGSNMALPTRLWEAVRDDVCLRNDIHEDLDLAIHLHQAGYRVAYRENLRVGVYLKRVWRGQTQLWRHMRRWPMTLRVHQYRLWGVGMIGNVLLISIALPVVFIPEAIARLFGRRSIT